MWISVWGFFLVYEVCFGIRISCFESNLVTP